MGVYKGVTQDNATINGGTLYNVTIDGLTMSGPVGLATYTVATLPAAASFVGALIYVSDGATGDPIVAFSDGTDWLRVDTKVAVASS